MSYNSKYTGEQVEGFLDQIANGEIGGGIEAETDPIFSASPAASITDAKMSEWDGKQEAISDLETIRDGASKGATALQSIPEEYVTEDQLIWTKVEGEAGVRLKGTNGTATGNLAISAGDDKTASDGTQFVSAASGDHSVAFGYGNTCAGRSTLAQGLYNTVNGKDSVAFGQRNTVNGDQAFAAGQQNEVTTRLGVAIGYKNKATNTDSIAIGYQNTSSGSASVAMGDTCEASGTSSTAMGYKTKATGAYSSTFGQNTQATNEGEVAMGLYNKSTTSTDATEQTLFSFGIGTSDTNRINALEIKKNGDVYIGDKLLSDAITLADTAVQPEDVAGIVTEEGFVTADDLAGVATSGSYNDLVDKPTFKTINGESISGSGDITISGGSGEVGPQGPQGEQGPKGEDGEDGVGIASVKQTTTSSADGGTNVVTVTLSNGTTSTFNVKNGSKGSNGTNGTNGKDGADGEDGATFTPSVDSAGNLSWTNDKGLTNPPTVNIKGPKGDKGDSGSGGGSSSGSGKEYIVVEPDLSPAGSEAYINDIMPNATYIVSDGVSLLSINDFSVSDALSDEYNVIFKADMGGTILTINSYKDLYWANGVIPTMEGGAVYELSIQRVRLGVTDIFNAVLTPFKYLSSL